MKMVGAKTPQPTRACAAREAVWGGLLNKSPSHWQNPFPSVNFPLLQALSLHEPPPAHSSPPLLSPLCLGPCQSLKRPYKEAATSSIQAQTCCSPSHMGAGPRQGELFPERTPILFREVTQKRGWAFSAGWMTSKDGRWGWRLVTGATQGGPTCPTRSGLALHPALCSEHRGTGSTATPPTRDSWGLRRKT